ncbi:MBL fold metallo-hydrolase [Alkalicoccus urumqiensis]|uniref:Metallo-beta-lactamase domain-containing protein n=1 Tax=Alkalicoccus urumqiensis TaxID=1548213 RepID=A0A2P6MJP1_ALKUR|nr:MBL fold metallo-hydrolase [Alkalicoccus urumqiensis]PRO66487.1 hypothetical protein C6I21_03865 [Alkalicoccus urumqiensis]
MHIQLIRNATLKVTYADKTFLIDPMLGSQGAYEPFPNAARQDQYNPLAPLPEPVEAVLDGVDAVIVTHLHLDHWDPAAAEAVPNELPLFVQNETDKTTIEEAGFTNVTVLGEPSSFDGIRLDKTDGEHGRGEILKMTGEVCGVVFSHPSEKTLYIAGDTVWNEKVRAEIDRHAPEVIVVNAGDNQFHEGGPLVMGAEDVRQTAEQAPKAAVVAVHMEAVNHWMLSRETLRYSAEAHGYADRLSVPEDGETLRF